MNEQEKTILIVDDSTVYLKMIKAHLLTAGYRIWEATCGEEAIEKAQEGPDLILLDIMMPGMDGFETCRRLKESETTREIPIIFLSSLQDSKAKATGLEIGGVDYINKPFDGQEFLARIKTHLTLREQSFQIRDYASRLEEIVEQRTRQLIHADRLATLGTFSSAIGHEINNPLTYIRGNIEFGKYLWASVRPILEGHIEEDESEKVRHIIGAMEETLDAVLVGSDRIAGMIRSLKAYARKGETQKARCRLLDTIHDALDLIRHRLKQGVFVEVKVSPEIAIHADRQKISQVFINLFNNAIDAMDNGEGVINIETRTIDDRIVIRVRDNGSGIPDEVSAKVFEPFFTMKEESQGTGLGLFIVRSIIEEHHGEVSFVPGEGKGAVFEIVLPMSR